MELTLSYWAHQAETTETKDLGVEVRSPPGAVPLGREVVGLRLLSGFPFSPWEKARTQLPMSSLGPAPRCWGLSQNNGIPCVWTASSEVCNFRRQNSQALAGRGEGWRPRPPPPVYADTWHRDTWATETPGRCVLTTEKTRGHFFLIWPCGLEFEGEVSQTILSSEDCGAI